MVELNFFLFSKFLNFTKLLIIANLSIIILLVNYFEKWLIFQIRNFWHFYIENLQVGYKISNDQMWDDRCFEISRLRILK